MPVAWRVIFLLLLLGVWEAWSISSSFADHPGDQDCADFKYQEAAQEHFVSHGGSPTNNVDLLDVDGDGIACETLPRRSEIDPGFPWLLVVGIAAITAIAGLMYWFHRRRRVTRARLQRLHEETEMRARLRRMDEEIERIELRLRELIDHALEGDTNLLPQHVAKKIAERIQRAEQQNAAFDSERYTALVHKLEFCDLRELEDVIKGKALWPKFEPRFNTKEALGTRFNQLAELRNCLRHSRSVDEITAKDGEVAIVWFNRTLAK